MYGDASSAHDSGRDGRQNSRADRTSNWLDRPSHSPDNRARHRASTNNDIAGRERPPLAGAGRQLHTDTGSLTPRFPFHHLGAHLADGTRRRPIVVVTACRNPLASACWLRQAIALALALSSEVRATTPDHEGTTSKAQLVPLLFPQSGVATKGEGRASISKAVKSRPTPRFRKAFRELPSENPGRRSQGL